MGDYFHIMGGWRRRRGHYALNPQPLHRKHPFSGRSWRDPYHVLITCKTESQHLDLSLTVANECMNRSMGISDYYPFSCHRDIGKLEYLFIDLNCVQQQIRQSTAILPAQ